MQGSHASAMRAACPHLPHRTIATPVIVTPEPRLAQAGGNRDRKRPRQRCKHFFTPAVRFTRSGEGGSALAGAIFNATELQSGRANPPGDGGVRRVGTPAKSRSGESVREVSRSGRADSGAAHGAARSPNRAGWADRSVPGAPLSRPPIAPALPRPPYRPAPAVPRTVKQGLAAHQPGAPTPGCARAAARAVQGSALR